MGFPIIDEIWSGIRWIIDFFLDKAPRPLLLLFFLLLVLLFGSVISMALQLTGIHCKTDKTVVKVDLIDVSTNVKVLYQTTKHRVTGEYETISDVHRYTFLSRPLECAYYLKNDSGEFIPCDDYGDANCSFYYNDPECYNCTEVNVGWIQGETNFLTWFHMRNLCSGDVYRLDEQFSILEELFRCNLNCRIPLHYKFNGALGQYECIDSNYCGDNATIEPDYQIDEYLFDAGYENLYQDSRSAEKNYERLITIECDENLNPDLTIFGIPIFDYKIWLLIFVIAMLFLFLHKIKN